jgi:signal transduction histidine kinase
VILAVAAIALVEVRSELQAVRSHRRLRARAAAEVKARVEAALPAFMPHLTSGTVASWNEALDLCLRAALASEGEVLEVESGRSLLSRPTVVPVAVAPEQARQALRSRTPSVFFAQTGPELRALTYVPFDCGGRTCVLRLATPAPDVAEDLRDRQQLFIAHLLALSMLTLAAGVMLVPGWRPAIAAAPRSLDAYEQAMGRLRDQGEARSRAHEAERRRMEDEIKDKEAMARAGELTAGIVHEVRNGLGTILGYARLLEKSPEAAEAAAVGRHVREECETLETVVRRFMDFVKRETLKLDTFDLVRTLTRVAAREGRSRAGAEVSLERLPESLEVVGDEELLERAFENLVRNAREAAGPRGQVILEGSADPGQVTVSILDDGPGFPPQKREELRPFFTTKPGGLGLGLAIAFKIVHLHGGKLAFSDRAPGGLAVRVTVPSAGPTV